ncbi:MAG: hypothetical protein AAF961_19535, partial [Planctomycetota bacterium]
MLGGTVYADRAGKTLLELTDALSRLERVHRYPDLTPISLSMQRRVDEDAGAEQEAASLDAAWTAWMADPQGVEIEMEYAPAARFAFDRLVDGGFDVDQQEIGQAVAFCDAVGNPPGVEYSEIALLRLLLRHVDWRSPALAASRSLDRMLAARRESESLAAPGDPRLHYLLAPRLRELDDRLNSAFDRVLVGSDEALFEADQILGSAGANPHGLLGVGETSYGRARKFSELALQCLNVRDDALAAGLFLSQLQIRRAKYDRSRRTSLEAEGIVRDGLEMSQRLDELIAAANSRDPIGGEEDLRRRGRALRRRLHDALDAYRQRLSEVQRELGGSDALRLL